MQLRGGAHVVGVGRQVALPVALVERRRDGESERRELQPDVLVDIGLQVGVGLLVQSHCSTQARNTAGRGGAGQVRGGRGGAGGAGRAGRLTDGLWSGGRAGGRTSRRACREHDDRVLEYLFIAQRYTKHNFIFPIMPVL